jgi:hypothetical protein
MRKRNGHRPPSGVRTADDARERLIIDLQDPVFAEMRASRARVTRPVAGEPRGTVRAEVIHLEHWKCSTLRQDKARGERDEDVERRETLKKHQAAVEEGAAARTRGMPICANPYRFDPIKYTPSGTADLALRAGWDRGWRSAIWPDLARPTGGEDERAGSGPKKRLSEQSMRTRREHALGQA